MRYVDALFRFLFDSNENKIYTNKRNHCRFTKKSIKIVVGKNSFIKDSFHLMRNPTKELTTEQIPNMKILIQIGRWAHLNSGTHLESTVRHALLYFHSPPETKGKTGKNQVNKIYVLPKCQKIEK